jgi:hypothetical protein
MRIASDQLALNDSRFTYTVIDIGIMAPCAGNWKNFRKT